MRARDQLIGAVTLAVATYFGVMRIAEAKCDAAVGSRALPLDESRPDDLAAFRRLQQQLVSMGQAPFAERLESLRRDGYGWLRVLGRIAGPRMWKHWAWCAGSTSAGSPS